MRWSMMDSTRTSDCIRQHRQHDAISTADQNESEKGKLFRKALGAVEDMALEL